MSCFTEIEEMVHRAGGRPPARPPDAPCQPPRRAASNGASHAAAPPPPPADRAPQHPRHVPEILVNFPGNGSKNGQKPGKLCRPKNLGSKFFQISRAMAQITGRIFRAFAKTGLFAEATERHLTCAVTCEIFFSNGLKRRFSSKFSSRRQFGLVLFV